MTHAVSLSLVVYLTGQILTTEKNKSKQCLKRRLMQALTTHKVTILLSCILESTDCL